MRKNWFSKNIVDNPPPPPPELFLILKKNILFFSIFKKIIKNSNNIHTINIKKNIQHTPMTWCTYLQSFEKIHQCIFKLVRKLSVTDGQTDGQGVLQYLPSPDLRRGGR